MPTFIHCAGLPDVVDLGAVRCDRACRGLVRAWRRLSGGGRTLLACSGGADSTALLLAMAASEPGSVVVGHVVHDLREREVALEEAEFVRSLALRLGMIFVAREVCVPAGNHEAGARAVRYDALSAMAIEQSCPFIATAHHGDDQFETVLMNLVRGAGLRGVTGIRSARPLEQAGVTLIRPMLRLTRSDSERICELAGVAPRMDLTNLDVEKLRAALRHGPLKAIAKIRPDAAGHVADTAELLSDVCTLVDEHVARVFGEGLSWPRDQLRGQSRLIVGEGLRRAFARLMKGAGMDGLSKRRVDAAVDAIVDDGTHERVFDWPMNVTVVVRSGIVMMKMAHGDIDHE